VGGAFAPAAEKIGIAVYKQGKEKRRSRKMAKTSIAQVMKKMEENDIKFVKLWFTDILGFLKSFSVPKEEMEKALNEGIGFDGSSIEGFVRIDESDMVAIPDPSTFAILPWRPKEKGVARMFCDIVTPDGKPFEGDPRYVLKRNLEKIRQKGYTYYTGPELEYFYFKDSKSTEILDRGGYFDLIPRDEALDLRRETVLFCEQLGMKIEYSHHEVAPSQHEIDMRYEDALTMADNVMTYRLVVKEVAYRQGVYATFMPKPLFGENGSGMHTHMSLFKGNRNAFFDPKGKYHLSQMALHFIGGLLKYAPEFTAVTCQWINSYKRLVPGYEAPVYLSWAQRNRSDLIRVPMYKPGKEEATRIEYRSPDPACNPYLAFSVMLAAGMAGVEEKINPPEPVEENVYKMGPAEREKRGIRQLPGSLLEALQLTENSKIVREALGDHVFSHFLENKKVEWDNYRIQITSYELEKYLPLL
jgi:glutamine synthetase